jgi:hypothetical protein
MFSFKPRCQWEWDSEVDRRALRPGDCEVASHLGALVPGDRAQQPWREVGQQRIERIVQGVAVAAGRVQEPD